VVVVVLVGLVVGLVVLVIGLVGLVGLVAGLLVGLVVGVMPGELVGLEIEPGSGLPELVGLVVGVMGLVGAVWSESGLPPEPIGLVVGLTGAPTLLVGVVGFVSPPGLVGPVGLARVDEVGAASAAGVLASGSAKPPGAAVVNTPEPRAAFPLVPATL